MRKSWKTLWPLATILLLMAIGYLSHFHRVLNFETLRYHHLELIEYVKNKPLMSALQFTATYIVLTTLSMPGRLFFSLLAGYLFPQPLAMVYVLGGTTVGATLFFVAAKLAMKPLWPPKKRKSLQKVETAFHKNEASYLILLRCVPLLPFWLVNTLPAVLNVPSRTFIWTTLVGFFPVAFVLTSAGKGFQAICANTETCLLTSPFNLQVSLALLCLGLFACIPILIKK